MRMMGLLDFSYVFNLCCAQKVNKLLTYCDGLD